jgi:hypothetical protein
MGGSVGEAFNPADAVAGPVCVSRHDRLASRGGVIRRPIQGELMESQPTGTSVVNDPMYQEGQALKFSSSGVTAIETVTFPANSGLHDVELLARASQSGGPPSLTVSVNGTLTTLDITNRGAPEPYTFDVNAPSGRSR